MDDVSPGTLALATVAGPARTGAVMTIGERLLAAAWLAGYRSARIRRASAGDLAAWLDWLREVDVDAARPSGARRPVGPRAPRRRRRRLQHLPQPPRRRRRPSPLRLTDPARPSRRSFIGSRTSAQAGRRAIGRRTCAISAASREGGFWVASTKQEAANQAVQLSVPADQLRRAAVLTDGAARLVDRFHLVDWTGLLKMLDIEGPAEVIRRVRAAESNVEPPRGSRGKAHDAT